MSQKLCEKCNVEIAVLSRHLKTQEHLKNDPDQTNKPPSKVGRPKNSFTKLCEKCNVEVEHYKLPANLKSETHQENDPDQTIKSPMKLCEKM